MLEAGVAGAYVGWRSGGRPRATERLGVGLLSAALLSVVWVPACADEASLGPEPACAALRLAGPPHAGNLVLIVNDTQRRDRIGAYGAISVETPTLDAFAAEHLLFERAFSQAPWTKPSIATLFTGLYPSQHRVASHPGRQSHAHAKLSEPIRETDVLNDAFTTLPEVLRAVGLRTGGFVSNPWLDRRFGFAQGFERYDDSFGRWGYPGTVLSRRALRWLDALDPETPFFLYVHYIDTHQPYAALDPAAVMEAPEQYAQRRRLPSQLVQQKIRDLVRFKGMGRTWPGGVNPSLALASAAYNHGVELFDRALAVLLDGLRAHPAWARTAVILTSDHGEALFDRGYGNHALGLYDDEIAIPLIARLPGVVPGRGRVDCAVGLVDLMPTLCDYVGADCPQVQGGHNLLAGATDGNPRFIVSEGVRRGPRNRSIRNRDWKLIWEPDGSPDRTGKPNLYALYDLRRDPEQRRDLLVAEPDAPEVRIALRALADALTRAVPVYDAPASEVVPVNPALSDRLEALGYVE